MSATLSALLARHGLTVESTFVPWSRSRRVKVNPKVGDYSLNWRVTLLRDGRAVYSTDYSMGIAHCASYKALVLPIGRISVDAADAIVRECETGRQASPVGIPRGPVAEPDALDVLHSLLIDSEAIDFRCFEEWAADFGYDADSRAAESAYRQCLACGLALRSGLGDALLGELRAAFQDY